MSKAVVPTPTSEKVMTPMTCLAKKVAALYLFASFVEESFTVLAKDVYKDVPKVHVGEGEDFSYEVTPEAFAITGAGGRIVSTSASGAKKLYKLLVKSPFALNLVGFADVPALLTRGSITFKVYGETSAPWDEFNTELARLLAGLKRDAGALKVMTVARGKGALAGNRKVNVVWASMSLDVLLGQGHFSISDVKQMEEVPF